MYDKQPCLWLVLKHGKDSHNPISDKAHPLLRVQFWKGESRKENRLTLIDDKIPVNVTKSTPHGDVHYVLLAMIAGPQEWQDEIEPGLSSVRLGDDERVVVQLTDSKPNFGRHREALWQADGKW
jgi:hypothetical protein